MYKQLLVILFFFSLVLLLPFNRLSLLNLWQRDSYIRRKNRVERACSDFREEIVRDERRRSQTVHPPDPNVLVSRKEKFLWCKVPKAASTSWKAYFVKHSGVDVTGMDNVQIDQHLQKLMKPPRWIQFWKNWIGEALLIQQTQAILCPGRLHSFRAQQRTSSPSSPWGILLSASYQRTEIDSLQWTTRCMNRTRQLFSGGGMASRLSRSTGRTKLSLLNKDVRFSKQKGPDHSQSTPPTQRLQHSPSSSLTCLQPTWPSTTAIGFPFIFFVGLAAFNIP